MHYYQKIQCPFLRVNPKDKIVDVNQYSDKYADLLKTTLFSATEKVDGINLNIIYDGNDVWYQGHTDSSNWSQDESDWINKHYCNYEFTQLCEQQFGEKTVQFCGELIGPKIQKNRYGLDDYKFVVFDIKINNVYINREAVKEITNTMLMDTVKDYEGSLIKNGGRFIKDSVPAFETLYMTIDEWATFMQLMEKTPQLYIGSKFNPNIEIEGFVIRPKYELIKANGERIIYKIKYKDIVGRSPRSFIEKENK